MQAWLKETAALINSCHLWGAELERGQRKACEFPELKPHTDAVGSWLNRQKLLTQQMLKLQQLLQANAAQTQTDGDYLAKELDTLRAGLQSARTESAHALLILYADYTTLESESWKKLAAFDRKGQGYLALETTHQTGRMEFP